MDSLGKRTIAMIVLFVIATLSVIAAVIASWPVFFG